MNEKQYQEIKELSVRRAVEATNAMTSYEQKGEAAKELIQKLKSNQIRLIYENDFRKFCKQLITTIAVSGAVFAGSYLAVGNILEKYQKSQPNPLPQPVIELKIRQNETALKTNLADLESTIEKLVHQKTKKEWFEHRGIYNEFLQNYAQSFYGNTVTEEETGVLDKILRKYILDFDKPEFMIAYWNKEKKKLILKFHNGLDRPILYGE